MTPNIPPAISESEIHAMYMDMVNKGQNAVLRIGEPPMSLLEWKDHMLSQLKSTNKSEQAE